MSLNWLGLMAWLIIFVLAYVASRLIRKRHLTMILQHHRHFSWTVFGLDLLQVAVVLGLIGGMLYLHYFRPLNYADTQQVKVTYQTKPLILQTKGIKGYYVKISRRHQQDASQVYQYWTEGSRYTISSLDAGIATGTNPVVVGAHNYHFPTQLLKRAETRYHQAYVANATARYRNNWLNGLSWRVGQKASGYTLIRIPSDVFITAVGD